MAVHSDNKWNEKLPLILLGIRSTIKQDLGYCSAESVYGTHLKLPGEYFRPAVEVSNDMSDYIQRLKRHIKEIRSQAPRYSLRPSYVPRNLNDCSHVFVRIDHVRKPLQHPYEGPFKVLHRNDKTVTIERAGKSDTVSIDRVRPAFIEIGTCQLTEKLPPKSEQQLNDSGKPATASTTPKSSTNRTTRSGRKVHWPRRYAETIFIS
ncbi:hypothetical protein MN116_000360 [Schistosoma mekongi]|uniref:Uncharacterized protein n=1 Tax=Schistosoma mekongi TaxID=38744 RepID=A0AAE1ZI51_SCHME|nr:hypothetical protein MN116_000360 [Schistosoma mekongi]